MNKPLVEAIFELRWAGTPQAPGIHHDPHYRLLVGRLHERVCGSYPCHEQLPTAALPDELVGYMVQHRFRAGEDQWPLLQVGPGIMTLNDTANYTWEDFRTRAADAVGSLIEAHPQPDALRVVALTLRYIDAVRLDYVADDVLAFLRQMMRVTVSLPPTLLADPTIGRAPEHLQLETRYRSGRPPGSAALRFTTGQRDGQPSLIWESVVQSTDADVPEITGGFADWLEAAHDLTDDWFFKLIEGDLERRFAGECADDGAGAGAQ